MESVCEPIRPIAARIHGMLLGELPIRFAVQRLQPQLGGYVPAAALHAQPSNRRFRSRLHRISAILGRGQHRLEMAEEISHRG